jgi:hypothetical protein
MTCGVGGREKCVERERERERENNGGNGCTISFLIIIDIPFEGLIFISSFLVILLYIYSR